MFQLLDLKLYLAEKFQKHFLMPQHYSGQLLQIDNFRYFTVEGFPNLRHRLEHQNLEQYNFFG